MRGIHDGKHPIVHMHILHIGKEELSRTKEGVDSPKQPSNSTLHVYL